MSYFSNSKLRRLVINALSIFLVYFRYPQQLQNLPESAYGLLEANKKVRYGRGGKGKIEFWERYLPGLESLQAYITVSLARKKLAKG